MAGTPGQIGPYEVRREIGRGGMGVVYLGRDPKLDRDVAIKTVPPELAEEPERLERFEREAKLLAALHHSNIAGVYGLEEVDGARYLVLEYVEGETLAQRLARGPLPLEDALSIARQMAEAVEAAHARGVIHRDLKPANIKIARDGQVKVLDFGLAKALGGEAMSGDPAESPTLTALATQRGVILGTAGYMSPEQARGRAVDKRADIWSFGCVLYEMLTGAEPFGGETATDSLGAILHKDPDWGALPADIPPTVHLLLRQCLTKDPNRRLHDIADARIQLETALADPTGSSLALAATRRRPAPGILPAAVACFLIGSLVTAAAMWALRPVAPVEPGYVSHTTISLPKSAPLAMAVGRNLAVSPDGRRIAYVARHGDSTRLCLRELNSLDVTPLANTEGALDPFFSPDGQWVGFLVSTGSATGLYKVSVGGQYKLRLAPGQLWHGSWGEDGFVYCVSPGFGGLVRVPDGGGEVEPLIRPDVPDRTTVFVFPSLLPGGRWLLFAASTSTDTPGPMHVQNLDTGEMRTVFEGAGPGWYLPSGHLLLVRGNGLIAVPFDLETLRTVGDPTLVPVRIRRTGGVGTATVSRGGTLAYLRPAEAGGKTLVAVDRQGAEEPLPLPPGQYLRQRVSPDGRRLVLSVYDEQGRGTVRLLDLETGRFSQLTTGRFEANPVWSPDGGRVAFNSLMHGAFQNVYLVSVEPGSAPVRLVETDRQQYPATWSPDGRWLVYNQAFGETGSDIWRLDVIDGGAPQPLIETEAEEFAGSISPDGRWLAYVSDVQGRNDVYVTSFPEPGRTHPVSPAGGTSPVWSRDRSTLELFYRQGNTIMSVDVKADDGFSAAAPRALFEGEYVWAGRYDSPRNYDVFPDGRRFVMVKSEAEAYPTEITVIQNWLEALKRLAPPGDAR